MGPDNFITNIVTKKNPSHHHPGNERPVRRTVQLQNASHFP